MSQILVFSERGELLLEMLGKAQELVASGLSDSITAVGWDDADDYARYGADRVVSLAFPAESQQMECATYALADVVNNNEITLVMIGATKRGKEIAARLSAKIDAPCVTDISVLEYSDSSVSATHLIYGGKGISKDAFSKLPLVVTVSPRRYSKVENPKEAVIENAAPLPESKIRVVGRKPNPKSDVDVSKAEAIVCVGRGLKSVEDLQMAQDLADVIGGVVACTRPISEDFGWLPTDRYIGLSGQQAAPDLHISLGCSGQIQHIAGVRNAKVIVAVDTDQAAPIWDAADYGIVGDMYEIVPELIKKLKG
ncbi:MAG: electron transfer flavoprotein subunit alpha/FixB family protein [Coriobacteriales bacterium]|jgi:electron transfer flavoprotein alpha subunit